MPRFLCCVSFLVFGIAADVQAFGTIHGLGQSAEHEKITRIALAPFGFGPKTLSQIAGKRGTFGAVGAPDHPARGLMSKSYAHCDGGDYLPVPGYPHGRRAASQKLRECRNWIFQQMQAAVVAAGALLDTKGRLRSSQIPTLISCKFTGHKGRAKCNVLEALGLAFHAGQDFYSHTNWTDIPQPGPTGPRNPPGLGVARPAPWLDPRGGQAMPPGLISGCYEGIPESRHCKNRVRHADLNKDEGAIDVARGTVGAGSTTRGRINGNYARAVRAAIADTQNKWRHFEAEVVATYGPQRGQRILCALRQDKPRGC